MLVLFVVLSPFSLIYSMFFPFYFQTGSMEGASMEYEFTQATQATQDAMGATQPASYDSDDDEVRLHVVISCICRASGGRIRSVCFVLYSD